MFLDPTATAMIEENRGKWEKSYFFLVIINQIVQTNSPAEKN